MSDYRRVVDDALRMMLVIGMLIGAVLILGGWALQHYVLSHVAVTWR